jgi:hypothetical protein
VYSDGESFAAGSNPGFFISGGGGAGKIRLGDRTWDFTPDESSNIAPSVGDDRARAVISAILRDRPWLTGGST